MSYASEVLADAPALYHRYPEASGAWQDSSGNGLHAFGISATPLYQQPTSLPSDPSDYSITFDEAGGYYVVHNALLNFGDVFTLKCRFKRTRTGVFEVLVSKGANGYWFYIFSDDKLSLGKVGIATIVQSTVTITDTNWHEGAVVKNGATCLVVLDGVDVTGTVSNQTIVNTGLDFNVGREVDNSNPFIGGLDELAAFPTALSLARLQAHDDAASGTVAPALRSQHLDYDYSR